MRYEVFFTVHRLVIAAIVTVGANSLAYADDRANKALEIDSWGAPSGIGKSEKPVFFVWQDERGFHVHTDSVKREQKFEILIETVGGRVLAWTNLAAMEGKKKKKKGGDRGWLSDDHRTIKGTFHTSIRTDCVDFTVDANTSLVRFRLLFNGEERPDTILIGAKKVNPPSAVFALAKKKRAEN